ncbi:MAG: sensor histidine kinase, partial [Nocardioidaceae bacterium]|nr:sensor histidine kinase [Nocardioidaceae bacterium]
MLVMLLVGRRGPGPLATVLAVVWSCILLFSYTSSDGPAPGGSSSGDPDPPSWLDSVGVQAGPDVVALAALASLAGSWLVRTRRDAAVRAASEQARLDERNAHFTRGERARIARELHDVVAHHLSIVAVQAETARLTTPGLSQQGADRFTEIGETARTALTEMRRLLGVLREDAATERMRHPQPGIAEISGLVDEARDKGGSRIRLESTGDPPNLDAGTQLTAYRIVQEALT